MSATADKALTLLDIFSESRPEIGLSEIARLANVEKATAHRMLTVLARHGLVEQHPQTKLYRLGLGLLRLARIREATFPVSAAVEPALQRLTEVTGETSHASLRVGAQLATIGINESAKSSRVSLEAGQTLPFHATASGIACMAFMPHSAVNSILGGTLDSYTPQTTTSREILSKELERTRKTGYAVADQLFEADVYGIAAPLFGADGEACGAIAVATPSHRMTPSLKTLIVEILMKEATNVSQRMGGEPPAAFLKLASGEAA